MGTIEEIKRLKALLDQGAISEEEFNSLKKKLISEDKKSQTKSSTKSSSSTNSSTSAIPTPLKKKKKGIETLPIDNDKISKKEAFKMLDKMDVGVIQYNLIHFIESKDLNKCELLLIAGLNPNQPWYNQKTKENYYPLHQAAKFGTPEIIKLLLKHNAEVNLSDGTKTPLFHAIEYGKVENVKILIENGANVNCLSRTKIKPLFLARKEKNPEIIELLLQNGAEEMTTQETKSRKRRILVKSIMVSAVVIGVIWFFGSVFSSASSSSSSSSDDRAVLHCKFCKKVVYGKSHEDITCYTIEPDGIGMVFFNSGTKYAFCSENCAIAYKAIN